jgi:hypothetical protein
MEIKRTSELTGVERTLDIPVTMEQLEAWHNGALIQNAMPHLTPGQREFLMTGITVEEWDEHFKEEDYDDDDDSDEEYLSATYDLNGNPR